jgi:hypothetical protein
LAELKLLGGWPTWGKNERKIDREKERVRVDAGIISLSLSLCFSPFLSEGELHGKHNQVPQ